MSPESREGLLAKVQERLGTVVHPTFDRPMIELGLISDVRVLDDGVTLRATVPVERRT